MSTTLEVGARMNGRWLTSPDEVIAAVSSRDNRLEFWPTRTMSTVIGQHRHLNDPALAALAVDGLVLEVTGPNPWMQRWWKVRVTWSWTYAGPAHDLVYTPSAEEAPLRSAA